jgi:hypothetical protein
MAAVLRFSASVMAAASWIFSVARAAAACMRVRGLSVASAAAAGVTPITEGISLVVASAVTTGVALLACSSGGSGAIKCGLENSTGTRSSWVTITRAPTSVMP